MFITIRHGNDQRTIFNSHCRTIVLLNAIRKICDCGANDVLDLADENGQVQYVLRHLNDYVASFLRDRDSYVLIKAQKILTTATLDDEVTFENVVAVLETFAGKRVVPILYTPLHQTFAKNEQFLNMLNPSRLDKPHGKAKQSARDDSRRGSKHSDSSGSSTARRKTPSDSEQLRRKASAIEQKADGNAKKY